MKLQKMFQMQHELDRYIEQVNGVEGELFQKKVLALTVELAELANETRCFKFWSRKGPSPDPVILEEYVDSVHFLLSLGILQGLDGLEEWPEGDVAGDLTSLFLLAQGRILKFADNPSPENYREIWIAYRAIARELGFGTEAIVDAYESKNEENYNRQRQGY
ncbi:dUTP diphosphatase [Bhargavaea ullalensis]|uniref:Dimeric dUTPase (All-alpha-NTP-PPase superfamily) n=1 Tax=Bhargavaea ullalensis TaxID=1265685 RepID=A0ABV2GCG7_9BACL